MDFIKKTGQVVNREALLRIIGENLTDEELLLLSKAVKDKTIKKVALDKLRILYR